MSDSTPHIQKVDFMVTTNGKAHRTSEYDISAPSKPSPKLVVRRGQPFDIAINFSKPFDPATDVLRLVFEAGKQPLTSKGTYVAFMLSSEDKLNDWGAKILSNKGNTLTVSVFTPPTCYVGKWNLQLDVVKTGYSSGDVFRYSHKDPIYVIFNPWCPADAVYMEEDQLLQEYVLKETGLLFSGNAKKISSKPWNFGQFESCALDLALYLLDVSKLSWSARGNPVLVTRRLTAMVNSPDDDGLVVGNWSGNYDDGRNPLSWTGSVEILEEYWKTKKPVKYGQCWAFAGVINSVCRALGIPVRPVTNFNSAHDTDASLTVDIHFSSNGDSLDAYNFDSIWNFHVWNEAWMTRPDLPFGYGGWQAIDGTPQETSDKIFRCGPMSVNAVRDGEVTLPYDGPFVFAEVNADRIYWTADGQKRFYVSASETDTIGLKMSTKAAHSNMREDITANYKNPEGSEAERASVLKANRLGSSRPNIYYVKKHDVDFSIEQDSENTWVGDDFKLSLTMKNNSQETRTVGGRIVVKTMFYTGVVADKVLSVPFENVRIPPGQDAVVPVLVSPDDYLDKLKDHCMLDVTVWAEVVETNQNFINKDNYRLRKPHLAINAPTESVQGSEIKVKVSFKNPINRTLTECVVRVDGLSSGSLYFPQGNVGPWATFSATLPITPKKAGYKELILVFSSKQLENINGSQYMFVRASD